MDTTNPAIPPRSEEQLSIPENHIKSFNYFLNQGLALAVRDLQPVEVELPDQNSYIRFWIESVTISSPCHSAYDDKLFPFECRQMGRTYNAPCFASISRQVNGGQIDTERRLLSRIPIMVKSDKCHIKDCSPEELVKYGEEANEMGGYFICNGLEKLIRLLIVPRANNPMAIKQNKNIQRGKNYTPYGIEIRCLRTDQTTNRNVIHYLTDGNCTVRFSLFKREYFVPVVVLLKAFINTTDREIYEKLTLGDEGNTFVTDRVELLLREAKQYHVTSPQQAYAFLGSRFRNSIKAPKRFSDKTVGELIVKQYILVHLTTGQSKFNYLIFLVRKLYAFVGGDINADNPDSQGNQDIMLPGHLYLMIVKEQLQEYLNSVKLSMDIDRRRKPQTDFLSMAYFQRCLKRGINIGARLENFLATGNVTSNTGLDLLQKSGYTIIAEKLNYLRYLSHFRGVHRGQFFTTMKTTKVRKLLPEAWGFLCPVHTPDGSPCGLLNHIAATCKVICEPESKLKLPEKLVSLGMRPVQNSIVHPSDFIPVMIDAEIVGYLQPEIATTFINQLRFLKVEGDLSIPEHLEIVKLGYDTHTFPGIYLFTNLGRMTRPVNYLKTGKQEWIGSLEQVYLEIACVPDDVTKFTTHSEIAATNMLSIVASLTPFSDFNQSPRNMYQCQMGKQTMATPYTAYPGRVDNKSYRIQTPQIPLVRNENQDKYRIDDYPNGTNALVAVISYTGYDMEDAMIINKSSYERGFGHGSVYKVETIDLRERGSTGFETFVNPRTRTPSGDYAYHEPKLDSDGLPFIGQYLEAGDPYLCIKDSQIDKVFLKRYKSKEPAMVDQVTIVNHSLEGITRVNIKFRINRNPIIGDKFSCYTPDHDILTKNGWISIDKVNNGDIVAIFDPEKQSLLYEPVENIYRYNVNNEYLYQVNSKDFSLKTTLNHKMYVKKEKEDKYELIQAKNIKGKSVSYLKNAKNGLNTAQCSLPKIPIENKEKLNDFIYFFGYWIDSGIIESKKSIVLPYNIKSKYIIEKSKNIGLIPIVKGNHIYFNNSNLIVEYLIPFYYLDNNKQLPSWCFKLTKKQSKILVQGLIDSNYENEMKLNKASNALIYNSLSLKLINDIQRLLLHAGWSGNIIKTENKLKISIIKDDNEVKINNTMNNKGENEIICTYSGSVHCVSVRTGIVYVRRNGKGIWSGNSRHGQKGVLSKLWPSIDMPFTESGMTPDIIINPHAFPSRMTIGMLIESMAGKSASLHGIKVNSTPFQFDEQNTAIDYFGEQLVKAGYNYYGNEPMYSGISGTAMKADIFYGLVYYQRLRHMVSDKFQVRSTGPNNNLTRQPVKGRKLGGGIRLGEMERDSLLAHGASFMLHDRLLNCSDAHKGYVCATCGSIISPLIRVATSVTEAKVICTYCDSDEGIRCLQLPFVFRYLTNELAAMNIRLALHITDAAAS